MRRRRSRGSGNRSHERFTDWLAAGPAGDPPRDLAVHAASCPECQRQIAAMDELAMVDVGLAGVPEATATTTAPWSGMMGRAALAASLVGVLALAFVGWRLFLAPGAPIAFAGASPGQEVDGGIGSLEPTPSPSPMVSLWPETPATSSPGDPQTTTGPTPSNGLPPPYVGPGPTPLPPFFPPPVGPTPRPTFGPPVTPRPTARPTTRPPTPPPPTPPPTPQPTPQPTPPPTPEPPTPPPPTPEPTPQFLPECADGVDNDTDGFTDLFDLDCLDVFDLSESS